MQQQQESSQKSQCANEGNPAIFCIVCQASMALCLKRRLRVIGSGGWGVAVGSDGYPLRVHCLRAWLEVTQLLLLLGVQPPPCLRVSFSLALRESCDPFRHNLSVANFWL